MRKESSIWRNVDWLTVILYISLAILGWLNIHSAIYNPETDQSLFDFSYQAGKQFVWICICIVTIVSIMLIDFSVIFSIPYLIYAFVIFALLLVFTPLGIEIGGNKSWLGIGSMRLQPAEFAKLAVALSLAKFIDSRTKFRYAFNKDLFIILAIIFTCPIIILLQPDTGSALVFGCFIIVLFLDGLTVLIPIIGLILIGTFVSSLLIPPNLLTIIIISLFFLILMVMLFSLYKTKISLILFSCLLPIAIGIIVYMLNESFSIIIMFISFLGILIYSFFSLKLKKERINLVVLGIAFLTISPIPLSTDYILNNVLKSHQRKRIEVLIDPESDPKGVGWNVIQSKTAIGSGGMWGTGYQKGTFTKGDYVPEQHTDFIFCTIGEEHGWIGSLTLILMFMALLTRILFVAHRQRSRFARVYGYSVLSILFVHFTVNIGMVIGLLPVIGIPLPFFSYGGSSLWSFTILLFVFLKLDMHRTQILVRG